MKKKSYAVFLGYNSEDSEAVERIAVYLLEQAKLRPWFDSWEVILGESWMDHLEKGLAASSSCAVFVGKVGRGRGSRKNLRPHCETS